MADGVEIVAGGTGAPSPIVKLPKHTIRKYRVRDLLSMRAPYNPRKLDPIQYEKLRQSVLRFGLVEPVVLNLRTKHIVGGHQRLLVLEAVAIDEEIDVVEIDVTEPEERALNVALNRISGEWDYAKLRDVIHDLDSDMRDLTGFTEAEMAQIEDGFGATNDSSLHWNGMPAHDHVDKESARKIIVHFANEEDALKFAQTIGQSITPDTKSLWFPAQVRMDTESKRYGSRT